MHASIWHQIYIPVYSFFFYIFTFFILHIDNLLFYIFTFFTYLQLYLHIYIQHVYSSVSLYEYIVIRKRFLFCFLTPGSFYLPGLPDDFLSFIGHFVKSIWRCYNIIDGPLLAVFWKVFEQFGFFSSWFFVLQPYQQQHKFCNWKHTPLVGVY